MNLFDEREECLIRIINNARIITNRLANTIDKHGSLVHFRPSSNGISIIGLLPTAPQRGKSNFRDFDGINNDFENMFAKHCTEPPKRVTPEKELQSYLISESYKNKRMIKPLNDTQKHLDNLTFITDEIALPAQSNKIVCDLLALRMTNLDCIPVVIELKSKRDRRIINQVNNYSMIVNDHKDKFEMLFSEILGKEIKFTSACDKWIVWPGITNKGTGELDIEPREHELKEKGITAVTYQKSSTSGSPSFLFK